MFFRIETAVFMGITTPSCTSQLCQWNIPKDKQITLETGLNKLHAHLSLCAQCACKKVITCMKLHAHKSIKIPLGSTPTLFKIVSYFCV